MSDSPSASVTVLEQVNVVLVVTLEDGVMTTLTEPGMVVQGDTGGCCISGK